MSSPINKIKRIQEFLDESKDGKQDHAAMTRGWRIAHFWALVVRGFRKNKGPVRASALAYTTLLALIPILALVVSVTTSLIQKKDEQSAQTIQKMIDKMISIAAPQLDLIPKDTTLGTTTTNGPTANQPSPTAPGTEKELASNRAAVVRKIMDYIGTISSGKLGITAGLALVFIAISVLSNIENTFNDIWGVRRGRTWFARIVQYWAAITLGPLFLLTAVGLTTGSQLSSVQEWVTHAPIVGILLVRLLPFVVLTVFLASFYRLMPATKVTWDAAFVGGLVGGCLLQLNNLFNVIYFSKVVTYSKIYGGLGVIPIFLVGLYFSWIILLFGAQVAYAYQNRVAYQQEKLAEGISQRGREFVALRIMTLVAEGFHSSKEPPSRALISTALGVPALLANQVLNALVNAKLLIETGGDEVSYVPGRPLEKISFEDILNALRSGSGGEFATSPGPERAVLREAYERVLLAEMHTAGAISLSNLVLRVQSLPASAETARLKETPVAA